jgi:hypothetical protein
MLRTRYKREVSNSLLDNGELVFDLHVAIEGLVFTRGVPLEIAHYVAPDGTQVWTILGHIVVYRIEGDRLSVEVVMPVM